MVEVEHQCPRRPPARIRERVGIASPLLVLLGLSVNGCKSDCPPGSVLGADQLCHLVDSADSGDSGDTGDSPEPEVIVPPDSSTPGWTFGEEEPCANPLDGPSYTDHSATYVDTTTSMQHVTMGSIGLVSRNDSWWFVSTDPDGTRWWSLDGSVNDLYAVDNLASRIALHDLDGDGIEDLLRYGTYLEIGWSFGTESEEWERIWESDRGCGFLEVGLADLDGNGLEDLILPNGMECIDETNLAPAILFNQGSRSFSDWVEVQGNPADWGATFDVAPIDIDQDGDIDLYFCNDHGPEIAPNQLLENDGTGTMSVVDAMGSGVTSYCMTASFGDFTGDGVLDLYVAGTGQHFALANADGFYVNQATAWGFPVFDELEMPWGSATRDFDNDGLTDIAITTSDFSNLPSYDRYPIWMMHQTAPGEWEEVGAAWGMPQQTGSRGLISHDLNDDGVLDLLAADFERDPWVLLSDGCTAQNWLEVTAPTGTIVTAVAGEQRFVAVANRHQGFGSSQPPVAHLGLGSVDQVDFIRLQVPWFGEAWWVEPTTTRRRLHWAPGK